MAKNYFRLGENMRPKVAIIVLNWNNAPDTISCLESIFKNTYPNYHVYLVDNASTDNSFELLQRWKRDHNDQLTLLQTHTNLGFSGGNNE